MASTHFGFVFSNWENLKYLNLIAGLSDHNLILKIRRIIWNPPNGVRMLPKCHLENYLVLLVDLDECSPHFSRPQENTTDIFSITFELEMYSFVK